jgi:hypothetical protein
MAGEDDAKGGAEGGVRWETYPAGAALLGMKVESFRRLAFRKAWRRTPGNDGLARVAIPLAEVEQRLVDHPHDSAVPGSAGAPRDARGGATMAELPDSLTAELRRRAEAAESRAERAEDERDRLAAEIFKEQERRARAEGEMAGLKETIRLAEEGRRDMQTERDAARTELAEQRAAFQQILSRVQKVEAERGSIAEARLLDHLAAQEAAAEAAAARSATTRAAAQAAEERAARQAAEVARNTAAAAAEVARVELAEWTAGGPIARAWRALIYRRGRP